PNSGLPPFSAPGWAKHPLVTSGPFAALKLQMVFWNQRLLGPVPCRIGIGPGPNQLSVLLLPGAFRTAEFPPKSIGAPLAICSTPLTCQPPSTAPAQPLVRYFFPLPNGSSYM